MDHKLYYCEYWKHKKIRIKNEEYDICVSPKINGNIQETSIQYHGIILKEKEVVQLYSIKKDMSLELANILLEEFEERLRKIIYSNVSWLPDSYDKDIVKIWFYDENEENSCFSYDKALYLPLRFAITVININALDDSTSDKIRHKLEIAIIDWLKRLIHSKVHYSKKAYEKMK